MKKLFLLGTITSLLVFAPSNAYSLEWSCSSMKRFVDSMYEASTYLNKYPNFDQNPKIEKALDEIIVVLKTIAKDEKIDSFTNAVNKMDRVWQKEEWVGNDINVFRQALDSTTVNLERVYDKYCDK